MTRPAVVGLLALLSLLSLGVGCAGPAPVDTLSDASVTTPMLTPKAGCPTCGSCQICDPTAGKCVSCGTKVCTDALIPGPGTAKYSQSITMSACTGGTCSIVTTTNCGNYACESAPPLGMSGLCATSCSSLSGGCAAFASCSSAVCRSNVFGTTCAVDGDCAAGVHCVDKVCCRTATCGAGMTCSALSTPPGSCAIAKGATCTTDASCASGHCIDGVCCNSACPDRCSACDVAGKLGTCSPVTGPVHGTRTACPSGTDVSCAPACNGTDTTACHTPPTTTSCGAATCTAGIETHAGSCDGGGGCTAAAATACGAYTCDAVTCKTTCSAPTDCAAGYYCAGGACAPTAGLGKPCASSTSCAGLSCTDGYCCGDASCGVGSTCGFPGHEGTCTKTNGGACTTDVECGSTHCADGVCCDSACGGQCEACDVPDSTTGRPGKCIPVKGKPHGTRTACTSDASNACSSSECDGSTTATCASFAGSATSCRAASCADGVYTAPATCDGKGHCPDVVTTRCDGTACTADGTACKGSCASNADCQSGYSCDVATGKCSRNTAKCSPDGLSSTSADGVISPCGAYLCGTDGTCSPSCGDSSECAPGFSCDTDSKSCVSTTGDGSTGSSGGCALGHHDDDPALSLLVVVAGAAVLERRRRRLRIRR